MGSKILMEHVNSLCMTIMMDPSIWRVVNVDEILLLDGPSLTSIQSHSQDIQKFTMTSCIITDRLPFKVTGVLKFCSNLTHLNLSGCLIVEDLRFLTYLNQLVKLELRNIPFVKSFQFKLYIAKLETVTWLDISDNAQIDKSDLLKSLEDLTKLWYLNVTDTVPLPVGAVNKICEKNPELETFLFYGLFWDSVYKWWVCLVTEDYRNVTFNNATYVNINRIKQNCCWNGVRSIVGWIGKWKCLNDRCSAVLIK